MVLGYRVYSEYTATGIAIPYVYRNFIAALTRQSILYNRATHPQTQQSQIELEASFKLKGHF